MPIYEISGDRLVALQSTSFSKQGVRERTDLQRLLREQIDAIASDVLIIGEEFGGWEDSKRRIDLLGIDRDANLVVIELKRTDDGGHMELQAIRYAAMVSKMTFAKAVDVYERMLDQKGINSNEAQERILQFLGWPEPDPDRFAQDVRIILASADFSRELTSAVLWLNERGLDIRCVRMQPYADGDRVFVDVQQVLPLPEASEYFVRLQEKREEERQSRRREQNWSGLWFVNVGMDQANNSAVDKQGYGYIRHWDNCVALGYVAAGHGSWYSDQLKRLTPGAEIVAYQKGVGYVGYGVVDKQACPVDQFKLPDGQTLEQRINLLDPNASREPQDWEYAVAIDWKKTFKLTDARTFKGVFAKQHVVCKLNDVATTEFVRREFDIPFVRVLSEPED